MTDDFWPSIASDWCGDGWGATCNLLDLSNWDGQSNLLIAFETYSGVGNPIFIDNVSISTLLGLEEEIKPEPHIFVYPNPTSNKVNISINDHKPHKWKL